MSKHELNVGVIGLGLGRHHAEAYAEHPAVARWLERVAAQPRYMYDLEPYPANARPGASRSVYD